MLDPVSTPLMKQRDPRGKTQGSQPKDERWSNEAAVRRHAAPGMAGPRIVHCDFKALDSSRNPSGGVLDALSERHEDKPVKRRSLGETAEQPEELCFSAPAAVYAPAAA
jgi:hypothetical protein